MSSMIDTITSVLTGDATLMSTLTGGIHRSEISRQKTPGAYDAFQELLPSAVVKQETQSPFGPDDHTGRLFFVVWLYQQHGWDQIEAARKRIYELLQKVSLATSEGGIYRIDHAGDLLEMEDEALGVSMAQSRFVATVKRT